MSVHLRKPSCPPVRCSAWFGLGPRGRGACDTRQAAAAPPPTPRPTAATPTAPCSPRPPAGTASERTPAIATDGGRTGARKSRPRRRSRGLWPSAGNTTRQTRRCDAASRCRRPGGPSGRGAATRRRRCRR
uniref:Uncharacterized protein n=1 Tax=Schlesneria paludicola TaxID=360056 RepID=A0A7C4LLA1_9PLAN